jgi:hypothetical protein
MLQEFREIFLAWVPIEHTRESGNFVSNLIGWRSFFSAVFLMKANQIEKLFAKWYADVTMKWLINIFTNVRSSMKHTNIIFHRDVCICSQLIKFPIFFLFAECHFGKELKELGTTWFPDLGAPFGKMYCIKCQCVPVS